MADSGNNPPGRINSAIYQGQVMHHRFAPKRHRFIYRVFSVCLDLDELPLLNRLKLFAINRWGLFSFHEKDHGTGQGQLRREITDLLTQRGYGSATASIRLLCYPRILGYTFNPLSVYFCYNGADQLEVILYEVSNTFGQRHSYLLPASDSRDPVVRHHCNKLMYVSPFMPMDTAYGFRIHPPQERVSVCIRQSKRDSQKAILHATFSGNRRLLTDTNLARLFISHPLMTLKVVAAIHWEALRLWCKGLRLQPRQTSRSCSISWSDTKGEHHYENL